MELISLFFKTYGHSRALTGVDGRWHVSTGVDGRRRALTGVNGR